MVKGPSFKVSDLLLTCAEYKKYGTLTEEINVWEILNPSIYLSSER